ncbi:carboxymuconolactone decarboxylase family protein [Mesorhizobium waimense]|uniref:Carboxymuconolactone decarboxylase family protein n=1 Tax=Mesorhizobium waimense TaxID=1300307 RepID=A0A3A5KLP0_9HYPH|nr:carboxymuconolactone decarboxylase family protein [Mesorhizobium waimense]RJT31996.1 carboxymuconolactone decarboxylase family protein [Mesorhizobium waimense]
MKKLAAATPISLAASGAAYSEEASTDPDHPPVAAGSLALVAPALEKYRKETLGGDLWQRGALSPRDRSVVTFAVMIARNQTAELGQQVAFALDNGVKPAEISETITPLAFYSGWGNAMAAVNETRHIFEARAIGTDQLPAASPTLLPIDQKAEDARAASVQNNIGPVSQSLVDFTGDVLFKDLWLRPDLAPRDRSLVTVSALMASGYVGQIPFHLNRAMDNGLTREEASEVLSQVAFYAGWAAAMTAVPVVKDVFEGRQK